MFGDFFLTRPEMFPTRLEGEAWGERCFAVEFLGGPYLFSGLDDQQERELRERFGSYETGRTASEPAPVETRVYRSPEEDFKTIRVRGWEYWLDVDYRPRSVRIAGLGFKARIEWRGGLTGGLWTSGGPSGRFVEAVENLFRVTVAYRVLEAGGILLHSVALAPGEGALVCPGRSGAGKSTLARLALAEGWKVLSDDLNVIVPRGSIFAVEQVPFAGELGRTARVGRVFPLEAICRIRKSDRDGLESIRPAEALGALLAASPNVNRDPFRSPGAEHVLAEIARAYTAYELSFSLGGRLGGLRETLRT